MKKKCYHSKYVKQLTTSNISNLGVSSGTYRSGLGGAGGIGGGLAGAIVGGLGGSVAATEPSLLMQTDMTSATIFSMERCFFRVWTIQNDRKTNWFRRDFFKNHRGDLSYPWKAAVLSAASVDTVVCSAAKALRSLEEKQSQTNSKKIHAQIIQGTNWWFDSAILRTIHHPQPLDLCLGKIRHNNLRK